ncbi:hypothetical protein HPB47_021899 [Ixodes persulcatus]|uniref:Uncharacterized protein n=1 Tax=Ixodes persulcatus TaxID=34615 RepID=A0AC60QBJ6_IXOPE|nr:hypothetical protein HPB47_021899 [Ixodes persulcatus]
MTAAGNRPTGNMEPTGDTCRGTGGSGVLCNQENRSRWKQTQATRQKRLPTLPVDDYRVVIRPRDGLNFSAWTTNKITQAIIAMAQLSAAKMAQATIRIHRDQNLVVVSTPNMESSTRVQQISALTLGTKQYEVTAYLAVPDNSCRGVISGVETRPTAEELTENLRATGINILYARMMGQTNTAVITFEGIRVPRFVYLSGGEYPCRPYQPRQQVCGVCLGLGDRTDVCPQPEQSRCTTCGAPGGAMEDHECTAHCVNCGGEHPATDPRCPARQRAPYNKEHVARYLREKEQQRTPPSPPPPLPYNALASHHWPELPSYNRVNPDTTIPTNVEEKEYDRSSSGPPPGQPSHTKRNATQERNGYRRNPSDNANKAKTQSSTRSRSQQREREQQRRPDQQNQPEINTPEPGHKGANVSWAAWPRNPSHSPCPACLSSLQYIDTTTAERKHRQPPPPLKRTTAHATDTRATEGSKQNTPANTQQRNAQSLQEFRTEIKEDVKEDFELFRRELRAEVKQLIKELGETLQKQPRDELHALITEVRQDLRQEIREVQQQIMQQIVQQLPQLVLAAISDPRRNSPIPEQKHLLQIDTHSERDHRETRRLHPYQRPALKPTSASSSTTQDNIPQNQHHHEDGQ